LQTLACDLNPPALPRRTGRYRGKKPESRPMRPCFAVDSLHYRPVAAQRP
jgi:hypothetical protein